MYSNWNFGLWREVVSVGRAQFSGCSLTPFATELSWRPRLFYVLLASSTNVFEIMGVYFSHLSTYQVVSRKVDVFLNQKNMRTALWMFVGRWSMKIYFVPSWKYVFPLHTNFVLGIISSCTKLLMALTWASKVLMRVHSFGVISVMNALKFFFKCVQEHCYSLQNQISAWQVLFCAVYACIFE